MSDMRQTGTGAPQVSPTARGSRTPTTSPHRPAATGWAGWLVCASVLMIIAGAFQAIMGLTALFNSGYYLVPEKRLLVNVDYTAWGVVHLVLGVVVVAAAFALLAGQMWARVVAVVMATLSAITNLAFLSATPVWSTLVIALDVLIVYAVTVHGAEMKSRDA